MIPGVSVLPKHQNVTNQHYVCLWFLLSFDVNRVMENFAFQNVFNDNEEEDRCSAIENINNNLINANDEGKKSKG